MRVVRWILGTTTVAFLAASYWWRTHPSPIPSAFHWMLDLPIPLVTSARLREILAPLPGERVLEVGPGTGRNALDMAASIPEGRLDIFDINPDSLNKTVARAGERGVSNIHPLQGDARRLPYDDESFDAAYLCTVLGEIPDQAAALGELRRVLKPNGRLIVGELALGDPHFVTLPALRRRATAAGLDYVRHIGPAPLGFWARFDASGAPEAS